MKTIPLAISAQMDNSSDVRSVDFDVDGAADFATLGAYVTTFKDWRKYSANALLHGDGRNSGRKIGAVNRKIQRQIFEVCKANSIEVSA